MVSWPQVNFVGGDKPSKELRDFEDLEVLGFKEALAELVKSVGVASSLGKTIADF